MSVSKKEKDPKKVGFGKIVAWNSRQIRYLFSVIPAALWILVAVSLLFYKLDEGTPDSRKSPAFGYSFEQEAVSSEVAAVNTVIEQYARSFNAGALDPEKALPEFIDALKAAGMDKIIAEQQSQLDAWAEAKTE